MSKTLESLRALGHVAHVDDERDAGNSIIVTLEKPFCFTDDPGCGVRGFDTVREARAGCALSAVYRNEPVSPLVQKIRILNADDALRAAQLPTYSQLLALVTQGVTTRQQAELDEDVRRNPGAINCGTFVLMTPAAWGAIRKALDAIDS